MCGGGWMRNLVSDLACAALFMLLAFALAFYPRELLIVFCLAVLAWPQPSEADA